jgi:hypothetical protein
MPARSARAWIAIWRAIAGRWRWCGSPRRPRRRRAVSAASARAWSRDRVRLTLRGKGFARLRGRRPAAGVVARADLCANWTLPADLRDAVERSSSAIMLADRRRAGSPHRAAQAAAPAPLPSYLGPLTWEPCAGRSATGDASATVARSPATPGSAPASIPRALCRLQGSITRHGNPRLRHVLVEAAWRLVRYQPAYHAVAKWREALPRTPVAGRGEKRSSSPSPASSPSTCGAWPPAAPAPPNSASLTT